VTSSASYGITGSLRNAASGSSASAALRGDPLGGRWRGDAGQLDRPSAPGWPARAGSEVREAVERAADGVGEGHAPFCRRARRLPPAPPARMFGADAQEDGDAEEQLGSAPDAAADWPDRRSPGRSSTMCARWRWCRMPGIRA
jgi:hypothetical protein